MVKLAVEFWWKMFLTIFPSKEARKSPSKLRRKFTTKFAENFANFTLEIAGAYACNLLASYGNANFSTKLRKLAILKPIRSDTPLSGPDRGVITKGVFHCGSL